MDQVKEARCKTANDADESEYDDDLNPHDKFFLF
jgi:hypothetical protein